MTRLERPAWCLAGDRREETRRVKSTTLDAVRAAVRSIHAGTDDPYNYDGLSYDTARPSPPRADSLVLGADGVVAGVLPAKPVATMDHRALVTCGGAAFTIGGMVAGPAVTDQVWRYQP